MMSRIPYPKLEELSEAKRKFVATPGLRLLNIIRMALHTPDSMWEPQKAFSVSAIGPSLIGPLLREVVVLRIGVLSDSEYELHHHRSIARNLGMADAKIDIVVRGDYDALDEKERVVAQFTDEVVRDVSPSDPTLAAARAHFSDAAIFEMVAIIGIYMMNARIIAVGGCEIDSTAIESWDKDKITS
jgi:alkylhydroperoxidase family enzyme